MSSRQAQVQSILTWIGMIGTDRQRVFAAPDLRATWALLAVSAIYLVGLALLLIVHLNGIVTLILVVLLLVGVSVLLPPHSRPLMWGMTVLLFLLARIPGFGPTLLILPAAGLFVCLRYLSRQSAAALYDPELQALSTVFAAGWKAYLPRDPDAQAQVRVLVSPDQQTFYLGIVQGRLETGYGTKQVTGPGLTAERLQEMAQKDGGVISTSQKVLWIIQPGAAEGPFEARLEGGVSTIIATRTELAEHLSDWSAMRTNLNSPAADPSEQGRRVETQAAEELQGLLPADWVMRTSILLAEGGDADIELTTYGRLKYVIDVKSRTDRMDLQAPKGDRAKSWAEIHAQVTSAAKQLQGVPVVWQPLARDEDFALVGGAWCLRGPAQALIEALGAMESGASEAQTSPYQVLGIQPGVTPEEIQAAYKRLVKQYHPDRVASLGEEFRHLAERRMKIINAAYQTLMEQA